jgi:hypothetical protein
MILGGMRELDLTGYRQKDGQVIPFSGGVIKTRPLFRSIRMATARGARILTKSVVARTKGTLPTGLRLAARGLQKALRQLTSTPERLSKVFSRTERRYGAAVRRSLGSTKVVVEESGVRMLATTQLIVAHSKQILRTGLSLTAAGIQKAWRQLASTHQRLAKVLAGTERRGAAALQRRLSSTKAVVDQSGERMLATTQSLVARSKETLLTRLSLAARRIPKRVTAAGIQRRLESIEMAIERWDETATRSFMRTEEALKIRMRIQERTRLIQERLSEAVLRLERRFVLVAAMHRQLESIELAIEQWDEAATESTVTLMKSKLDRWMQHPRFAAFYERFKSMR